MMGDRVEVPGANKAVFDAISGVLRPLGFKKLRFHWYRSVNDIYQQFTLTKQVPGHLTPLWGTTPLGSNPDIPSKPWRMQAKWGIPSLVADDAERLGYQSAMCVVVPTPIEQARESLKGVSSATKQRDEARFEEIAEVIIRHGYERPMVAEQRSAHINQFLQRWVVPCFMLDSVDSLLEFLRGGPHRLKPLLVMPELRALVDRGTKNSERAEPH